MNTQKYSSVLLDNAVNQLAGLPGIGRKTALRLALHLLREDKEDVDAFVGALRAMRHGICYCRVCQNISDSEVCEICSDGSRDRGTVCVVETVRDVMAIENTRQYRGLFHVLGGVISPMDGIGPDDLNIRHLEERVARGDISEVIFALSTTMEGDTTNYYLYKKLSKYNTKITTIARGVSVGDELQYTDEITLGRSLVGRIPFENTLTNN